MLPCALQLDSPAFCLDGGLSGVLQAARLVAEHHLDEELAAAAAAPYSRLRRLSLGFSGPSGLQKLGLLAVRGGLPAVRQLRLAWQPAGELKGLAQGLVVEVRTWECSWNR